MTAAYYLYSAPYRAVWHILDFLGMTVDTAFYCDNPLDYAVFENVAKHLSERPVFIAKNKETGEFLKKQGINPRYMPVFPKKVVMATAAAHKFSASKIKVITMSHGPGRFKRIKPSHFKFVDLSIETGRKSVEAVKSTGFENAVPVGFPKLDPAFDAGDDIRSIEEIKRDIGLDCDKPTVLFSATWDKSGMSAIDLWHNRLDELTEKYNVMVTLHMKMSPEYKESIKANSDVIFVDTPFILDYLRVADVLIGDVSSIVAEFSALDKPIITFKTPKAERSVDSVLYMIGKLSKQVRTFDELKPEIAKYIDNPRKRRNKRNWFNRRLFEYMDGKSGKRAAELIMKL